jgi:hypothetical protein
MSFDLVDKAGGEIRATAWNDQVDQFQDMIQVRCKIGVTTVHDTKQVLEVEIFLC